MFSKNLLVIFFLSDVLKCTLKLKLSLGKMEAMVAIVHRIDTRPCSAAGPLHKGISVAMTSANRSAEK